MKNSVTKFIIIFFLAGILGGALFGFTFALCILGLIYSPELCLFFSLIISLFYIPSIWRQIKQKTYLVIIRKFIEILFFATLLNCLFLLEEEIITFNSLEWNVIYICLAITIFPLTIYLILEEYYNESWLYKEISHIVNGMQIYGLLPKDEKEK